MAVEKEHICQQHKEEIVERINKIAGQLEGIKKMLENNRDGLDILTQMTAVRAALKKTSIIVVEHHMVKCFQHTPDKKSFENSMEDLKNLLDRFVK